MFDFTDSHGSASPARRGRSSRRSFLSVGSLGLGSLALPTITLSDLLAMRAAAAEPSKVLRDKAVVFLFMHGGPSQLETFDPKMSAPDTIRSATGEIKTSLKGVTYGSTFRRLARLADKTTIVRSFATGTGNHDIKPIVCKQSLGANIGSLYARVAGSSDPSTGMPRNAAIFPRAVDPSTGPRISNFGNFLNTAQVGNAYAPFVPGAEGPAQQNMTLGLPRKRLDDRRALLERIDGIRRDVDQNGLLDGADRFQQQAFDVILGGVSDAFDLSQEDPRTLARYNTAPLIRPDQISKKWNNYSKYVDNVKSLGKLMLLARRMVERGCGFVTVTTNFVWDMHADRNNATMTEGMRYCGHPFDHAVSAFIEDIEARGLRDKVLLVCCGEMGRTPKINKRGGRDHWGKIAPLMLYGGGLEMGQVIGRSTADAGEPDDGAVGITHLMSTIMHTLLDVGEVRLMPGIPNDVMTAVTGHQPIPGLL